MEYESIIILIIFIIVIIYRARIIKIFSSIYQSINGTKLKSIKETSYIDYAKFYGQESLQDKDFIKKLKIIYEQIIKYKENDIHKIAQLAGCTYIECIIKIRYLKQIKKISQAYFVDEVNGLINVCSKKDQELLKKYRPYIYRNQLQINDIVARIPPMPGKTAKETAQQVMADLIHLDNQGLIDGIILNKVDGTITYYNKQTSKKKDKITINCQNCGAPNIVNRGGKTWCSYCKTIVEDTKSKEKENKYEYNLQKKKY